MTAGDRVRVTFAFGERRGVIIDVHANREYKTYSILLGRGKRVVVPGDRIRHG